MNVHEKRLYNAVTTVYAANIRASPATIAERWQFMKRLTALLLVIGFVYIASRHISFVMYRYFGKLAMKRL